MIADSALYTAKNLVLIKNTKWISRVPLSIKKAKNLVRMVNKDSLNDSNTKGYSYYEEKITYGEIEQRWILIEGEERKNQIQRKT